MKCEIAQDLLTLYAEELCSPETVVSLEAHLAECPACSKKLADYKSEITEKLAASEAPLTENVQNLKPMKKVQKKLSYRKWLAIVLGLLLLLLLGGIGYLSYGQLTNRSLSFSALTDIYKLNKVTKAFAEGDTRSLIDTMSFTVDETYIVSSNTDFDTFEDYKNYLKDRLDHIYDRELREKDLTVKLTAVHYLPYEEEPYTDSPLIAYQYTFFDEADNATLSITFNRMGPDKYTLFDYWEFSESPTNAFTRNFLNYLLPNEDVIINTLLQYRTRVAYEANMSGQTLEHPGRHFATLIRYDTPGADAESVGKYKTQLEEKVLTLYENGIYFKDVLHNVDTFDKDTGYWIYKVSLEAENQSTGERCIVTYRFRYYGARLYVIPGEEPEIIGADALTDLQTEQFLTLFNP